MKIATKTGDRGKTGLLYGADHDKSEEIFDAIGDLDELNAFIGMAKATMDRSDVIVLSRFYDMLPEIQKDIMAIMGELNCIDSKQVLQYISRFGTIKEIRYVEIDEEVSFLQGLKELEQKHWILYGSTEIGAILDICSKVCRRGERSYWKLYRHINKMTGLQHREILGKYLNRLSDFFYLLARLADYRTTS
jgi:cob(I)alamin adenosyltransferase